MENRFQESNIEGRNAVLEAFRSGRTVDKLFVLEHCEDGPVRTILREAKKQNTIVKFVKKERLDQMSRTGTHQGVIAQTAAYAYAQVEDILEAARKKGEPPFLFVLDNIEDPHNLGAIIRTANLAGAHGVIIPKNRAAGLTAVVARTPAATEAFKESISPFMGIDAMKSHVSFTSLDTPWPSLPITSPIGPFRSRSYI